MISLSCWKHLRDGFLVALARPPCLHSAACALPAKAAAALISEQIDVLRAVTDLIQQSLLLTSKKQQHSRSIIDWTKILKKHTAVG